MTSPMLLVVRHSESTFSCEGRWAGWLDPPLTDAGTAAARQAAERWRTWGLAAATSSDLRRARQGAEILSQELGIPLLDAEPGVRERNAGIWQGQIVRDLEGDPLYQQWRNQERTTPPDGESYPLFLERLQSALQRLTTRSEHQLVVTHDGVLTGICQLLSLPRPPMLPLVDAVKVTLDPEGTLSGLVILSQDAETPR
jgi:broad specificity phosphatase PhoE